MLNSNLTRLQTVSSSLDTAIDKANNLPEAENLNSVVAEQQALITELSAVLDNKGSNDIETCQISITKAVKTIVVDLHYTDENLTQKALTLDPNEMSQTIQVARETIIYIRVSSTNTVEFSGDFYELYSSSGSYFATVSGDGQIYIPESLPA